MVDPDRPAPPPTLNPKAKHYERQLHKIFAVDTAAIWLTQQDWIDAKAQLENLAKDVRAVRTELTAPSSGGKGWTGPAAQAAQASLQKLSDTLDGHAVKVGDVDTSLKNVYDAVWEAKNAWDEKVASISTYVDPADHKRLPGPYAPTAENAENHSVTDHEAVAAAEDARWEQRNQAAKQVLQDLGVQTQEATGKMPIEAKDSGESPYSSTGSGPGADYSTNTSRHSTTSGYDGSSHGLTGTGTGDPGTNDPDTGIIYEPPEPEDHEVITIEPIPEGENGTDPISSDGDTTGSTGLPGPGTGAAASHAGGGGGGGTGPGGVAAGGVGAGAAGLGGLLGARRGGGLPGTRGGGVVAGGGSQARGSGAGSRGSAFRSGGSSRAGQVIPGGGGGQARGGAAARGSAVKGATGSGRYGVPKLDGRGSGVIPAGSGQAAKGGARGGAGASGRGSATRGTAGRGGAAMGAAGASGSRGARQGGQDQTQDADKLTHEDEETWYDGTEESSPQVWD